MVILSPLTPRKAKTAYERSHNGSTVKQRLVVRGKAENSL
jgi:hypothetical protein